MLGPPLALPPAVLPLLCAFFMDGAEASNGVTAVMSCGPDKRRAGQSGCEVGTHTRPFGLMAAASIDGAVEEGAEGQATASALAAAMRTQP